MKLCDLIPNFYIHVSVRILMTLEKQTSVKIASPESMGHKAFFAFCKPVTFVLLFYARVNTNFV